LAIVGPLAYQVSPDAAMAAEEEQSAAGWFSALARVAGRAEHGPIEDCHLHGGFSRQRFDPVAAAG
jgi:hypothetical protein